MLGNFCEDILVWGNHPWRFRLYLYSSLIGFNFLLGIGTGCAWVYWLGKEIPKDLRPYLCLYAGLFSLGALLHKYGILPLESTPPSFYLDASGQMSLVPKGFYLPDTTPLSIPTESPLPAPTPSLEIPEEETLTIKEYIGYFSLGVGIVLVFFVFECVE